MRYIGLDIHKRVVQACVLDADGRPLANTRFELTRDTLAVFAHHHLDDDCALALEATTNTWAIVDVLAPFCPRIVVSNPMRTKAIASAKIKTDKVDALVLAQLLRCDFLPSVWTPDAHTRDERALASRRSALTRQAISLKNRIHSVLHQRLIVAPAELFSTKGMLWLRQTELPLIARGEIDTLLRLLDALQIEQAALRADIDRAAFASAQIKLLMTLPGIDATIAHALMAAIGNIGRFACADKLAAYFGLVPSVHQSAEHCHLGPITKQGNTNVRWLLIQAAQIAARHPGPLGHQFEKLARRKNRSVAVVAIAHKLAVLTWHLLTRNSPYRYALPTTVETKLARLRVSQQGRRRSGPNKGQPLPTSPAGRTRRKKSLDAALTSEHLPPTTPAPNGEQRMLTDWHLTDFAQDLQRETRIPRHNTHTAPRQTASAGG